MTQCKGQLHHRFHDPYSCVIFLFFETTGEACNSLPLFGEGFIVSKTISKVLIGVLTPEQLDVFKEKFFSQITISPCSWKHCGKKCKAKTIDSISHSLDDGPKFVLTL